MISVKDYARTRGVGYILALPATVLAIVSIILYKSNGINMYATSLNGAVFASLGVGIGLCVISMVIDYFIPLRVGRELVKPLRVAAYLLYVYALLQFILSQITLVGAAIVAIDVDQYGPLLPGFIATFVLMICAAVLTLVSALLNFRSEKEKADER